MDGERTAEDASGTDDEPAPRAAWPEKIVAPLVVVAISVAAVLATLMQPRSPAPLPAPPAMQASDGGGQAAAPGSPRVRAQRSGRV